MLFPHECTDLSILYGYMTTWQIVSMKIFIFLLGTELVAGVSYLPNADLSRPVGTNTMWDIYLYTNLCSRVTE